MIIALDYEIVKRKEMKVYSLTGPSGTGKSYQAPNLMMEREFDALIDDGLFIYKETVEAGISAKRQKTKVGAIKVALFNDEALAESVKKRIREINPESILVIGISDKMVDRIVARLELPEPCERIYIEDITSARERSKAKKARIQQGKHVIPVPTLQLKRDFAGYFMNPQKLMRQAKDVRGKAQEAIKHPQAIMKQAKGVTDKAQEAIKHPQAIMKQAKGVTEKAQEAIKNPGSIIQMGREFFAGKTVVRPTYSYLGDFLINEKVIKDIIGCVAGETRGINKVVSVYENAEPENLKVIVVIDMDREVSIWKAATEFQRNVVKVIERMTAFNVVEADIEIRDFV